MTIINSVLIDVYSYLNRAGQQVPGETNRGGSETRALGQLQCDAITLRYLLFWPLFERKCIIIIILKRELVAAWMFPRCILWIWTFNLWPTDEGILLRKPRTKSLKVLGCAHAHESVMAPPCGQSVAVRLFGFFCLVLCRWSSELRNGP